jgi:hypothetical protein
MAINPTERLNYEKYITLGHKHLPPSNRRCGKRRVAIQTFSKELRENFSGKNSI